MFEAIQALAAGKGMTMSEYVRGVLETQDELQLEMEAKRQMKHPAGTGR
jgi:hypothetical protein